MTGTHPTPPNSTASTNEAPASEGSTASDPRPQFAAAYAAAGAMIAGIGPDQEHLPTPCTAYTVAELRDHLRMVAERVAAVGRGEPAFEGEQAPPLPAGVDHATWWRQAGRAIDEAWPEARLTDTIELPWAVLSGADTLAGYVNELCVHGWDLAVATGQSVSWDDDVVATALASIRAVLPGQGRTALFDAARAQLPDAYRDAPHPFAEPVPVPPDAPLVDQLLAWNGRCPDWRP